MTLGCNGNGAISLGVFLGNFPTVTVESAPVRPFVYSLMLQISASEKLLSVLNNLYRRGVLDRFVIDEAHCVSQACLLVTNWVKKTNKEILYMVQEDRKIFLKGSALCLEDENKDMVLDRMCNCNHKWLGHVLRHRKTVCYFGGKDVREETREWRWIHVVDILMGNRIYTDLNSEHSSYRWSISFGTY